MKRGTFLTAMLSDSTGSINLMWFKGVEYIKESLKDGEMIASKVSQILPGVK